MALRAPTEGPFLESCLDGAAAAYSKIVDDQTKAKKKVKLTLDKQTKLPTLKVAGEHGPSCLGGITLACCNGSLSRIREYWSFN